MLKMWRRTVAMVTTWQCFHNELVFGPNLLFLTAHSLQLNSVNALFSPLWHKSSLISPCKISIHARELLVGWNEMYGNDTYVTESIQGFIYV